LASAAQLTLWLRRLRQLGRQGVALRLLTGAEFRADVVQALLAGNPGPSPASFVHVIPDLLHRSSAPAPAEVAHLVRRGGDLLTLETTLAAGAEFFADG
jgi:hypothetical protein